MAVMLSHVTNLNYHHGDIINDRILQEGGVQIESRKSLYL